MNSKKKEQVVFQLPRYWLFFPTTAVWCHLWKCVPVSDVDTQNPQYNRDPTASRFREC